MWQSHKIKRNSSAGKLKDMCGSPRMEIGSDIHPEERKYGPESVQHLWWSQINTSETVPQIKQKQVKVKRGSKSSKLKETVRSSKVSLSEKIPIEQIKDTSIWHTRYWRVPKSPGVKIVVGSTIERVSNIITILW